MDREEALARLRRLKPDYPALKIRRLALFGSTARNEAGPKSDLDLLVELEPTVDLFEYMDIKERLAEKLDCSIDLITFRSAKLRPRLTHILEEAVDV